MAVDIVSVYDEFLDHLAQQTTPEQILAFKASESAQQRADELTERNKAVTLTAAEAHELAQMLHFNRLVAKLKASGKTTTPTHRKRNRSISTGGS